MTTPLNKRQNPDTHASGLYFDCHVEDLLLTAELVKDPLRTIKAESLTRNKHVHTRTLSGVNEMTSRLWDTALTDIESNIVKTENGTYFGAGKVFGLRIFTRDIAFSGIFGVNSLYPEIMLSSLKVTRDVRFRLGLRVSKGHRVHRLKGNWIEDPLPLVEFLEKHQTTGYTRRTDDVVWLWAAMDLFERNPDLADWEWMYEAGLRCFEEFYIPFYDSTDGLYRGQAPFVDIHYPDRKATGYPHTFSVEDCVLIKSSSGNALYYQGLKAMAHAAEKVNKTKDAAVWTQKAEAMRKAIISELRYEDGTFSYFKHADGTLEARRDALGSALLVITGIVEGEDARKALKDYPVTWAGVPLFHPFFSHGGAYHNNTAWPFVDTFFLWAKEIADNKDYTAQNAALLARTCIQDGSFHEVTDWGTKEPKGSGSQLWSASAFVNVCRRAGLL